MKPMISSLKRLTSQDTKTPPPPGVMMIVWLPPPLSQDPIPAAAVKGRHLMRMESDDNGGSEAEETREALTTREMGIIFPGTKWDQTMIEREKRGERVWPLLASCKYSTRIALPGLKIPSSPILTPKLKRVIGGTDGTLIGTRVGWGVGRCVGGVVGVYVSEILRIKE
jgi:hypothetical protein